MPAVDPHSVPTQTFDWGAIKWLVSPDRTERAGLTFGEVVLLPGRGHDRHNHPTSEEILYVLSGEGEQMVSDGPPFKVHAGDTIFLGGLFQTRWLNVDDKVTFDVGRLGSVQFCVVE